MGLPAAPLVLLLLLLQPMSSLLLLSPCFPLLLDISEELDLSNRSSGCAELDWSPFQRHRRLLLRHNGIEALSPSARLGPALEELDLAENRLRELPRGFFSNATALRELRLEGNPLRALPRAAFQPQLRSLSLSCRCDLLATVVTLCARSELRCLCFTPPPQQHPFNATEFHARHCGLGAGLVAAVAAAVAGLVALAVVAALWWRRRRAGAAVGGVGRGKQNPTGNLRQPRYISRDTGSGPADVADVPDYENVFVSPGTAPGAAHGWAPAWREPRYSPQVPLDEDYFLESAADPGAQPIYANTLGPTEDIYIVPAH